MNTTGVITDREVLIVATEAAALAPSVRGSQPWRLTLSGDVIDVFADRGRWSPATEASNRELIISCGTAICFARLALRGMGREVRTELLPRPGAPDHLARLTVSGRRPPSVAERALIRALPIWCSARDRLDGQRVSLLLLEELCEGMTAHRCWLRPLDIEDQSAVVELLAQHGGSLSKAMPRPPGVQVPRLLLIGTSGDDARARLETGQALGWLMLRSTADGVIATPMFGGFERPELRDGLRRALRLAGHPQLLLRLG